jgi:hypothetical protein
VLKLPRSPHADNADANATIRGWHVIRIDDLHLKPIDAASASVASKNVLNKNRPKLKGSGVVPLSPSFRKSVDSESSNGLEDEIHGRDMIYSVPNAKYYKIVTTGCQMNVADSVSTRRAKRGECLHRYRKQHEYLLLVSFITHPVSTLLLCHPKERIMGVLEKELGLTSLPTNNDVDPSLMIATKKKKETQQPDILLLNTCTIRDHAEQKVYDALGPYAALKREGKPLAIVVAGCVAQQEGEL